MRRVCSDADAAGGWGGARAGLGATSPRGAGHSAPGAWRLQSAPGSRHDEPGTPGQRGRQRPRRGRPGGERAARWAGRSVRPLFARAADARTAQRAPGVVGAHCRQCAATPWRREGARRPGGVLNAALAVRGQRAGACGRSTRARPLASTLRAVVGQALDPRAAGGRGQGEGGRDRGKALALDDLAHGLGTAEDAGCPGLCYEGLSGREGVIGKGPCEGPPLGVSSHTIRHK